MIKKIIGSWLIQLFCIAWALFLFLDYINFSSYFPESFKYFKYTDLIITSLLLTAGIAYLLSNRKISGPVLEIKNFRGIYHYGFLLLLMFLVMLFYLTKTGIAQGAFSSSLVFIFRTIAFHSGLGLILLSSLSTGAYFSGFLPLSPDRTSSILISLAVGFFIVTLGLFILGAFGLLHQLVVIPFMLFLVIPGWKKTYANLRDSLLKKSTPFKIHLLAITAYVFLLLLIAVTLIYDTRTIPVGYDSLSLYMNTPRLIAGYHGLTQGGDAYNWSLMMSLGFIMYNNTVITILISVVPGILCLFALYKICMNLNISRSWGIYACTLFYSLPNTIWQSRNDEKTDFALLFVTLCCVLLFTGNFIASATKKTTGKIQKLFDVKPENAIWALCGCLIGYTFGIKYVAMLSVFAFLVILFYSNSGKYGAAAIFFLNFAIIFGLDLTRFAAFERDQMFLRFIVPFSIGLIFIVITSRSNLSGLITSSKKAIFFLVAAGLTFLPWAVKNTVENKKISIESLLTGKTPLPELYPVNTNITGSLSIPASGQTATTRSGNVSNTRYAGFGLLAITDEQPVQEKKESSAKRLNEVRDSDKPKANSSTNKEKEEEIRRYIGYETGIIRFISLPYDIVMKANVQLISADSGILLLIIIPVFMFIFSYRQLPWNILKFILMVLLLALSVLSIYYLNGSVDINSVVDSINKNSFRSSETFRDLFLPVYLFLKTKMLLLGQSLMPFYKYLTTQSLAGCFVIITFLSVPVYFLFRRSIEKLSNTAKSLIAFVYCIIAYWLVLSSGIIWYGIAGFSLVPVIIALMATNEEQTTYSRSFIKRYIIACSAIWFILILPFQFMPPKFLYSKDNSKLNFNEIFNAPFAKYAIGASDEKEVMKQFFTPVQLNIIKSLNSDKNSKILNVSTFLNYYIVNNDARVYKDNQLGIFKGMYTIANNDKSLLAKEFKKKNIRYILVSLNTAAIDKTADRSLTKKFDELMTALVNNPEVQLLYTNRVVERPDGDMDVRLNSGVVKAKYDVIGRSVIDPGTDALFEIL